MAGYREFQTGEVLTAGNVNSFLMEQATMTFADAAARDAALAGVLRAGLNAYLQDTDRLQYYDGTDWQNVPNEADVDAAGGLVAVKSAIFTGTQSDAVLAGANFAVTDLEITHEVADPANKLIISAFLGAVGASGAQTEGCLAVAVDGTLIAVGDSPGNRTAVTAGGQVKVNTTGDLAATVTSMPAATFVYVPGAGSKTYTVRAVNMATVTATIFVNRQESDSDTGDRTRAVSSLVIQEVKV